MASLAHLQIPLSLIGCGLTTAEETTLHASLSVLGDRVLCPVMLWGKILGVRGDYYVSQTVPNSPEEPRLSFFSVDGVGWTPLEAAITPEQVAFCENLRGRFIGSPDYEYKIEREIPPAEADASLMKPAEGELAPSEPKEDQDEEAEALEDEEEAEAEEPEEGGEEQEEAEEGEEPPPRRVNKPKKLIVKMKESIRLAHFVYCEDVACRLLVRGTYLFNKKTEKLVKSRTFGGYPVAEALKLRNYFKLSSFPMGSLNASSAPAADEVAAAEDRITSENIEGADKAPIHAPLTADQRAALIAANNRKWFGPTYNEATDFLAPVAEELPKGVWSSKYDALARLVTVENLFYPGSLFWYEPESASFGQFYYGTGERDLDLCWELPVEGKGCVNVPPSC